MKQFAEHEVPKNMDFEYDIFKAFADNIKEKKILVIYY